MGIISWMLLERRTARRKRLKAARVEEEAAHMAERRPVVMKGRRKGGAL